MVNLLSIKSMFGIPEQVMQHIICIDKKGTRHMVAWSNKPLYWRGSVFTHEKCPFRFISFRRELWIILPFPAQTTVVNATAIKGSGDIPSKLQKMMTIIYRKKRIFWGGVYTLPVLAILLHNSLRECAHSANLGERVRMHMSVSGLLFI